MPTNIEIKATSSKNDSIRKILQEKNADFKGEDHQIDTYFVVPHGRLKLREATLATELIHYAREEQAGPKHSAVTLYKHDPNPALKEVLSKALEILAIIDKKREIYFIENVKFHLDTVEELGTFMEIEAIDTDGSISKEKLLAQCTEYMELFGIAQEDLLTNSYSDMIVEIKNVD